MFCDGCCLLVFAIALLTECIIVITITTYKVHGVDVCMSLSHPFCLQEQLHLLSLDSVKAEKEELEREIRGLKNEMDEWKVRTYCSVHCIIIIVSQ